MKYIKLILIVSFYVISFYGNGQQSEYFYESNSDNQIYAQQRIKECRIYASDFKIGFIPFKYLERITYYDTLGNLIKEREYLDRDKSDGWEIYYHYNENRQLTYDEQHWVKIRSFSPSWRKSVYQYTKEGQIKSICEFHAYDFDTIYRPDSCRNFIYKDGLIHKVLLENLEVVDSFNNSNSTIKKYVNGELVAGYKDNLMIIGYSKDKIHHYQYNQQRQLIKIITYSNNNNDIIKTVLYEYNKYGLPSKTIYLDSKGHVTDIDKYRYKRY